MYNNLSNNLIVFYSVLVGLFKISKWTKVTNIIYIGLRFILNIYVIIWFQKYCFEYLPKNLQKIIEITQDIMKFYKISGVKTLRITKDY